MCDSHTFSVPTIILASGLIIVKLVLHVVLYSRTKIRLLQIVPKFAVSDTASVPVHYSTSSYPLPPKSGFRVWVWGDLSGRCKAGLNLEE